MSAHKERLAADHWIEGHQAERHSRSIAWVSVRYSNKMQCLTPAEARAFGEALIAEADYAEGKQ